MECRIRQALLEKFVVSEIDRTHQWMIDVNPTCDEADGLRRVLVANSLVVGRDFTELDDWLAAVREDLASEHSTQDLWDDDFDTSGDPFSLSRPGQVADDPQPDRDLSPMFETRDAPITSSGRKISRNGPCPCGSGKKYKKCCLKKQ